ncbi:alpha-amylase family protein [Enemella sp. A6]|uniref:alpha-amylase family protein n=1 Tax=Enemella sp. A6 TaxID=3440152 RepID=UPI003EBAFEF2
MSLLDHAIWWHVYPLGAVGAPIHDRPDHDPGHRLGRLTAWLDYVIELGCSGLLLGPVFDSTSHGYDTLNHFRIDPRLGDDADWDAFVAEAHSRGLSIVLDGVFNHVGINHALVAEGPEGPVKFSGEHVHGWEGHTDLAELDHADPRVADLVTEVMCHWLGRGAAGWRLDVAYAVPPEFWREVLGRVREQYPEAIFIGEVIHGDYARIAADGTLDSVTAYELWKAIWSSLVDANMWELAHALERHDQYSRSLVLQTFIGNHDVTRIANRVGDAGVVPALAVLMTVPGMPSIYYGDEQGYRGERLDGYHADDQLRPPLPDTPEQLADAGRWLYRVHQQLIGLRRRHPWLTRGRIEVVAKDNAWIEYAVTGEDQRLDVRIDLEPSPAVRISSGGSRIFEWRYAG